MNLGEENGIDFNFEDLEFIGGDVENLVDDDTGTKESTESNEQQTAASGENQKPAGSQEATQEAAQTIENNEDTAEGENPERVGGKATDEDRASKESSPQLYHTLATLLKEEGVFSSVDESSLKDVNDVKTLVNVMKKQIQAEEFSDLTEQQKIVLADMRAGVEPTTASKFKTAMDKLDGVSDSLIEENKQARFDLIYQDFLAKGFDANKASKYANRSFELGEDKADALEARDSLKRAVKSQYDASKQRELDSAAEEKAKIAKGKEDLKERILKSPEIMEGVEVNEGLRHEIYDEMNNIVSTNPKTGVPENALMKYQRENPIDFSHKLYYMYKVTNGFKDLGYFGRRKESNTVKSLETALRQSTHVSGGGDPSFVDDGESHILDIGDLVLPGED